MITETLESHAIPFADCREQGYDNAANTSGKYNGAQTIIKKQYPTAIFSPCGCHTFNLCRNDAAECISEASTYFKTIQTICVLLSCSPKRYGFYRVTKHPSASPLRQVSIEFTQNVLPALLYAEVSRMQ